MKKQTSYLTFFLLFCLFNALNAGFYSFINIPLGFCSYVLLFFVIFVLVSENNFCFDKFVFPFILAFLWLVFLLLWKNMGTFLGLYSWFLGSLVFFALSFIDIESNLFSRFFFASFIFSLLFSFFEIFTGLHLPSSRFFDNSFSSQIFFGFHIPTFYFTNENDFSAYLIVSFCYVRAIFYKKKILIDIILLPFVIFILFISSARLCLIAITIYYFYRFYMKINKKLRYFLYFLMCIVTLYLFIKLFIPYLINNIQSAKSSIIRVNLLIISLKNIFIEKNFLGLGPAAFPSIIGVNAKTHMIVDPHNWFMELGVEVGLIFLILYILFIIKYFMYEKEKLFRAFFVVFLICNFCSSRFSGILWNWFFLAVFMKRYFSLKKCDNYLID